MSEIRTLPAATGASSAKQRRSYALDALRGYAILTMVLSSFVPAALPAWMHHAQVPPPKLEFNPNLPGITWVDLVFPFFLFSMGAAIPLALSRRIESGIPYYKIILGAIWRWFLLIGFSLYAQHTCNWMLDYSTIVNQLLSILSFIFCFAALIRLPDSWHPRLRLAIKIMGFAGAIAFILFIRHADGKAFDPEQIDIIIQILANVSLTGAVVWLVTRKNMLARIGIMGVLVAFRLAAPAAGWVNWLYGMFDNIPYSLGFGVHQYLLIIIPATIVGDMVLDWMKSREQAIPEAKPWNTWRLASIVLLMSAFIVVILVGLMGRWLWQATAAAFVMCLLGWALLSKPSNTTQKLLKDLYAWGAWCLMLGLAFEPYEGGIKKDSATMSYYFVTAGLAIFMLIAFTIIIDIFGKRRWVQLLIDNGQNPMIAYVGRDILVIPILGLTYINPLLDRLMVSPWAQFGHGVITTLIIALVVSGFTKLKLFWRT